MNKTTLDAIRASFLAADKINPALIAQAQAIQERAKRLATAPLLPYQSNLQYQAQLENFERYAARLTK